MSIDVTMPKLSDTMEEGKVLRWLKHVGDRVAPGDVLAEVETDKADMELEAYDEGVLAEVRTQEGETVAVGTVIAVLAGPGEGVTAAPTPPAPAPPKPPAARAESPRPTLVRRAEPPPPAAPGERVRASPLARRVAEEHGVDLAGIAGSGPGGRIVERDVRAAVGGREAPASPAEAPAAVKRIELGKIRRTTARRMAEAKREVPHFYVTAEVAMDEAAQLKAQLARLGGEWEGLTFTHLLLKATGLALRRVPEMNASLDGDALLVHEAVNVGLATAVDDGLLVPVVRSCDATPLRELVRDVRGLVERARAGRPAADDLTGATFTLSNLGMYPVAAFAAVVNPPQAAILAVGTVRDVPVVRGGVVSPGRVMSVTLSCDHRIVDGALAGRFLAELKALLEAPVALVV
ncbi:MAG TPA: dihydrolipoamide acetyltransferase family protein [Candidatus Binatia bacterium]|nr:dihydrolipoamide acetyltransferase family protein [Candidatus Binatia bacterium]